MGTSETSQRLTRSNFASQSSTRLSNRVCFVCALWNTLTTEIWHNFPQSFLFATAVWWIPYAMRFLGFSAKIRWVFPYVCFVDMIPCFPGCSDISAPHTHTHSHTRIGTHRERDTHTRFHWHKVQVCYQIYISFYNAVSSALIYTRQMHRIFSSNWKFSKMKVTETTKSKDESECERARER